MTKNTREIVLFLLAATVMLVWSIITGCGGSGGNASVPESSLPKGCVDVGSIANSGGPIIIIAACQDGTGNVGQTCFSTGAAGSTPVPVPCDNGGSGQSIGPTPVA